MDLKRLAEIKRLPKVFSGPASNFRTQVLSDPVVSPFELIHNLLAFGNIGKKLFCSALRDISPNEFLNQRRIELLLLLSESLSNLRI